jgi:integrase
MIVQAVQGRGAIESAKRLFTQMGKVFKFAIAHGECTRNPCGDIERSMVLQKPTGRNYPTITDPKEIGRLLYDIDHYTGWYMVRFGLLFLAYSAIRPGNVRLAEWSEIDWDNKQWVILAAKMKTGKEHIVPLSRQMLEILQFAKHYATGGNYIFFSNRHKNSPMSDVTFSKALWRMGYGNKTIVPHGFRAMFSTIANEHSGYGFEIIETQLAHKVGSRVSQAYNRAKYLQQRKKMMQWWADWLDEQKARVTKENT